MAWNVVIAGGGFGGFYAARTLDRLLPPHSARIRVVNDVKTASPRSSSTTT